MRSRHETGLRLGAYEILRTIAAGRTGLVLEVKEPATGASRAAKILTRPESPLHRARFQREAELLARCDHPNVVKVHASGETPEGDLYIVLDLVAGEDLETLVQREGRIPALRAARLALDVARGLGAMHEQGIVHRDVKPANILVAGGDARITDLGVATAADLETLTKIGGIVGTPLYMAPEQAAGEEVGPPADVFALGCVLFHALTGRPPLLEDGALKFFTKLAEPTPLPSVRTLAPEVPEALAAIVARALAKPPAQRPRDGAALAAELERFLSEHGGPERRGRTAAIVAPAGLIAILALGAGAARAWLRQPRVSEPGSAGAVATLVPPLTPAEEGDALAARGAWADAEEAYTSALAAAAPGDALALRCKRGGVAALASHEATAFADVRSVLTDDAPLKRSRRANAVLAPLAPAVYRRALAATDKRARLRDLDLAWSLAPPPPAMRDEVVAALAALTDESIVEIAYRIGTIEYVLAGRPLRDELRDVADAWDRARRITEIDPRVDFRARFAPVMAYVTCSLIWEKDPAVIDSYVERMWGANPGEDPARSLAQAYAARRRDQPGAARRHAIEAVDGFYALSGEDPPEVRRLASEIAAVLEATRCTDDAVRVRKLAERAQDARTYRFLARVHIERGEHDLAREAAVLSAGLREPTGDACDPAQLGVLEVELHVGRGELAGALARCHALMAIDTELAMTRTTRLLRDLGLWGEILALPDPWEARMRSLMPALGYRAEAEEHLGWARAASTRARVAALGQE